MNKKIKVVRIEKCGCCVVSITAIPDDVVVEVYNYDADSTERVTGEDIRPMPIGLTV